MSDITGAYLSDLTLADLSKIMRDIDFAMLSTRTERGAIAARPMSNNGEVDYNGVSFFFADDSARMVSEIASEPKVGLTFTGAKGLQTRHRHARVGVD